MTLLDTIPVVLTECRLNVYKRPKHESGYVKADLHRGNLRRARLSPKGFINILPGYIVSLSRNFFLIQ